jgi:uncharacterized protein (TIGR02271 family)
MTQKVITAFFDNRADATKAIDELVKEGIPRTSVKLMPETETSSTTTTTRSSYDRDRDEKGFWASLGDLFLPDEDRYTYAEAMHRGSIMVSATVDAAHADRAEDILEKYGTVNIEERESSWRKEGWKGYSAATGVGATAPRAATPGATGKSSTGTGDETISVVEEQLKIGKRQVSGGRVKVRSYVVETPVTEQVSLRDETVRVERRPMDRALTEAESGRMFQDRTIEAEERDEEAVVSKNARVTGEVVVKKGVEQRTETVSDTVRSTKVEVDDERTGVSKTGTRR